MRFLGGLIKNLLRSIFSIVVFLLLVGLAKTNRNMGVYIDFLDGTDWSVFHWSQPATWTAPFWQNQQISGDIADILSGDSVDSISSGLDVYDPAFEQEFNTITDTSLSGSTGADFGFTTDGDTTGTATTSSTTTPKSQLLNLIQKSQSQK